MRCQFTIHISLCPRLRSPIAAFLQPSLLHKSRFRLRERITWSVCDALSKQVFCFIAPLWLGACKTPHHPLHAMATSTIGSPTPLPSHTVHQAAPSSRSFESPIAYGSMQAVLARRRLLWQLTWPTGPISLPTQTDENGASSTHSTQIDQPNGQLQRSRSAPRPYTS